MRISKSKLALAMLNAGITSIKELAKVSGVTCITTADSSAHISIKPLAAQRVQDILGC